MIDIIIHILTFFGCEDAAQQVLMSVCLSARGQPENLPFYIILQHPECSRMYAECMQNVQNIPERMQNVPEHMQTVPECMHNVPECSRIYAECSRMFQNACRSMSLHAVVCISLHAVT